jgi:CDP-diacylglycerol--serine O-phosphatidyltransferase
LVSKYAIPNLLKLKDYVTLTGTILGLISLICASIGIKAAISLGFFLVTIAIGTDLIDGYIARKTGTVNEMGKELDSLSDSLTFGISPAILTFQAFKIGGIFDVFLLIACICFALGAILRLARFNLSLNIGYTGVPTPISALLLITYFYFNYFYYLANPLGNPPFPIVAYYIIPFILIFIAWLNITTHVSFGKKGRTIYILFLLVAPLGPIFGIIGILNPNFYLSIAISIMFMCFFLILIIYILLGSWIQNTLLKRRELAKKQED